MFGSSWALLIAVTLGSATGAGTAAQTSPSKPPETKWTDDRPATHFFPNLFRDLKALPSKNSAGVYGIGGASALAIHATDDNIADWTARIDDPSYTIVGRVLGDGWFQSGGAVATYALGRLAHSAEVTHIGSDLIRAQALTGVLNTALKVSVNRTRPNGGHYAFPSGHTAATFTSAATLHAHYGWKAGVPAYAAAGFVAWTRARDGVHWLSDVVFGAAVGIASGRTVAGKHGPKRIGVVPTATKGGAALYFNWQLTTRNYQGAR